jgi:hypothetical protein
MLIVSGICGWFTRQSDFVLAYHQADVSTDHVNMEISRGSKFEVQDKKVRKPPDGSVEFVQMQLIDSILEHLKLVEHGGGNQARTYNPPCKHDANESKTADSLHSSMPSLCGVSSASMANDVPTIMVQSKTRDSALKAFCHNIITAIKHATGCIPETTRTEQNDQEEMVYYLHRILTSAYSSQQMKWQSGVDMTYSTFEIAEKSLAELAFSVEVQISMMQYMPHAVHTFLTLIKNGLFLATSLTHDGKSRLVGGSPASGHRKPVQSQLSPSKMKECEDIEFWSRLNW